MFDQISTPRNPADGALAVDRAGTHRADAARAQEAGALSRRGVGFGDRVLILMLNRTEFLEAFLAANKLGAIAVPVNFRMTPPEIAFLVSDCQARVMITEAVLAKVATAVRGIDPTLANVAV